MKKTIKLAGVPVGIELRYPDALSTLAPYLCNEPPAVSVSVPAQELAAARDIYEPGSTEPYIEYMELCQDISDALLPFGRVVFHGAAFMWRGRAWIFAALSGTGKTTQYLRWKELYGDEVQIINGDKPVLSVGDGSVTVHPSPWNGKEGMGQQLSAPLGGIILLRQSSENRIRRVSPREAVGPVFVQLIISRVTADNVRAACRLEDIMLRQTPVWRLENRGDAASAMLCRSALMEAIT